MEESNFVINKGSEPGSAEILITGEMSVYNITELKDAIYRTFLEYNSLIVRLQEITSFDLAGIQVLHSLKKSAASEGKNVRISADLSAELLDILVNSGFTTDMITS